MRVCTLKNLLGNNNKELQQLSTRLLVRLDEGREKAHESDHIAVSTSFD